MTKFSPDMATVPSDQAVESYRVAWTKAFDAYLQQPPLVEAAADTLAKAEERVRNARAGDDPDALLNAVEAAELELKRAKLRAEIAAAQVAEARGLYEEARHRNQAPAHAAAVLARINATRKAEAARKAVLEAQEAWQAANQLLGECVARGRRADEDLPRVDLPPSTLHLMPREAQLHAVVGVPSPDYEIAFWMAMGLNLPATVTDLIKE